MLEGWLLYCIGCGREIEDSDYLDVGSIMPYSKEPCYIHADDECIEEFIEKYFEDLTQEVYKYEVEKFLAETIKKEFGYYVV